MTVNMGGKKRTLTLTATVKATAIYSDNDSVILPTVTAMAKATAT